MHLVNISKYMQIKYILQIFYRVHLNHESKPKCNLQVLNSKPQEITSQINVNLYIIISQIKNQSTLKMIKTKDWVILNQMIVTNQMELISK